MIILVNMRLDGSNMKKKKVIILGAGPAGLTAAYELLKKSKDYDVVLIEKDSMVGGISKTCTTEYGKMDLGGHRFFTKQERVLDFWNEILSPQGYPAKDEVLLGKENKFLVPNGLDPEVEDKVFLKRNRVSRIYYHKKFFSYPITINLKTMQKMGFLTTLVAGCSYFKAQLKKRKEDSLENFYINHFGKKLYEMFFASYTEKIWGRSPKEISASWGKQRVKGVSVFALIKNSFRKVFHLKGEVETSLIESFYYPKYGPGQMWEEVKNKIVEYGGVFYLSSEVVEVHTLKNKITSVVIEKGGKKEELKGDVFFSSLPIKDLLEMIPRPPKKVLEIAKNLPYRNFVTVGVLVKKLKLKNETSIQTIRNQIPDCWVYIQDSNVEVGRMQIFNNWSPYMVKDNENTLFIGLEYFCNEDDRWNRTSDEWKTLAKEELVKMDFVEEEDILACHVEKVEKAYPAYFDSYEHIEEVISYLNKYDNLYCVGRNGQHRYNNMDHSMMTSLLAVDSLLEGKKMKEDIWNVNTESTYHEGEIKHEHPKKI